MATGPNDNVQLPGQLIVTKGDELGSVFSVGKEDIVIGRGCKVQVQILGDGVSREHVRITRDSAGAVLLRDLESANGTYVNGSRADETVLRSGDRIRVGAACEFEFRYEVPDDRDTADLGARKAARSAEQNLAAAMRNLGRMHMNMSDWVSALGSLGRARAQLERRGAPDKTELVGVLADMAACHLELGATADAELAATQALGISAENGPAGLRGTLEFSLARALEQTDPVSAREHATAARSLVPAGDPLANRIDAWLHSTAH